MLHHLGMFWKVLLTSTEQSYFFISVNSSFSHRRPVKTSIVNCHFCLYCIIHLRILPSLWWSVHRVYLLVLFFNIWTSVAQSQLIYLSIAELFKEKDSIVISSCIYAIHYHSCHTRATHSSPRQHYMIWTLSLSWSLCLQRLREMWLRADY